LLIEIRKVFKKSLLFIIKTRTKVVPEKRNLNYLNINLIIYSYSLKVPRYSIKGKLVLFKSLDIVKDVKKKILL
jgi:hypothetical protein